MWLRKGVLVEKALSRGSRLWRSWVGQEVRRLVKTWISNDLRLENEAREFVDILEGWARAWIRYSGLEKYPGGKK